MPQIPENTLVAKHVAVGSVTYIKAGGRRSVYDEKGLVLGMIGSWEGVTNKLIAKGYGETRPIADNHTESGRLANRRIELIWLDD